MGLTGSAPGDSGEVSGTQVNITSPGHELAGPFTGTPTVFTASRAIGWGIPAPSAVTIASTPGAPSGTASIFAYEAGASLAGASSTTTERRVAFFARTNATTAFTAIGWDLFTAAVGWAGASDADGDGLGFVREYRRGTDPTKADTDGDGYNDLEEVEDGTSPMTSDADGDGVSNADEIAMGTDPYQPDTDGDGYPDSKPPNPADCYPLDPTRHLCATDPTPTEPPRIERLIEPRDLAPTSVVPPE
jgi:hypothetical protein